MRPIRLDFASDNISPASPEILEALSRANTGTEASYGADRLTEALEARVAAIFEHEVAVLPVTTGTAANALALAGLAKPFEAIYCHATAHVMTDECGAPEFYSNGAKLIGLPGDDGRIQASDLEAAIAFARSMGVHHVQPAAVTLSQATEWGTVYRPEAIRVLTETAKGLGLRTHMDGARFANALVHLGATPAEVTWKAGIDVLSLGATKNGALAAEALLVFDRTLAAELGFRRKRAGHLWSKMRYLSAQLLAYLTDDLWLRNARRANEMAARLAEGLRGLAGIRLVQPVEANELFVAMPQTLIDRLRESGYHFYDWPAPAGVSEPVVRLVTAFDVEAADVDALLQAMRRSVTPNATA
jgi:threonine aldolase